MLSETPRTVDRVSDDTTAPTDGLWSRLRLIEGQPLADRASAYAGLHDELARRLDSSPKMDPGTVPDQHPAPGRR